MLFRKNKYLDELPEEIANYVEQNSQRINKNNGFSELKFSVIDSETSGLNTKKHSIVSFAGVRISNRVINIGDSLDILINAENNQDDESVHIHEITAEEKTYGISSKEALVSILSFMKNSILVGFNTQFDINFLNKILKKYYRIKILNPVIDVSELIARLEGPVQKSFPENRPEDLEEICKRYDIPIEKKHTAAGDVLATAQLFLKILSGLEKRGITTWRNLRS